MAKNWEKSKKDTNRQSNDREFSGDQSKKKKLKPVEKVKYRNLKTFEIDDEV